MKRDLLGHMDYWDKWIEFENDSFLKRMETDNLPGGDKTYRPTYVFGMMQKCYHVMLRQYSRGDEVSVLSKHFDALLDAWEKSDLLSYDVFTPEEMYTRKSWVVNLDHYVVCFWLTGLALCLHLPDAQWERLVKLMGNEGADTLLDRVIATRQPGRKIGETLCFPKAYKKLYDVIQSPPEKRAKKLAMYLKGWYVGLKNAGHPSFPPMFRTPYWHAFGTYNFEGGAYFGHWCVEAVAVAKAFHIDDTLCLPHPNYPGDLLQDNRSPRYPDVVDDLTVKTETVKQQDGWLKRILRKV